MQLPHTDMHDLRRAELLREADAGTLAAILRQSHWRMADAGTLILACDDPSGDVFFIATGMVRMIIHTSDGRELLFRDLNAGQTFGELAAIDGKPRSVSVVALTRVRLRVLPGPAFLAAISASPPMCRHLLRTLSHRIREDTQRMLELATLPVRDRLAAELLRLSRPRATAGGERVISPAPSHQLLAARIGTRREMVSREMSRFAQRGAIITTRQAIILLKPETLRPTHDPADPAPPPPETRGCPPDP